MRDNMGIVWTENVFNLLEKHINTKKGTRQPSKWHLEKYILLLFRFPILFDKNLGETNIERTILGIRVWFALPLSVRMYVCLDAMHSKQDYYII